MKRNTRPELKVVANYKMVNGEPVQIDPTDPIYSDLHDRCKLAWAEVITGCPHELVNTNETRA